MMAPLSSIDVMAAHVHASRPYNNNATAQHYTHIASKLEVTTSNVALTAHMYALYSILSVEDEHHVLLQTV